MSVILESKQARVSHSGQVSPKVLETLIIPLQIILASHRGTIWQGESSKLLIGGGDGERIQSSLSTILVKCSAGVSCSHFSRSWMVSLAVHISAGGKAISWVHTEWNWQWSTISYCSFSNFYLWPNYLLSRESWQQLTWKKVDKGGWERLVNGKMDYLCFCYFDFQTIQISERQGWRQVDHLDITGPWQEP